MLISAQFCVTSFMRAIKQEGCFTYAVLSSEASMATTAATPASAAVTASIAES